MTSNLTVCHMAAMANLPHVERAAIRASLIEQAVANRHAQSAKTRNPARESRPGVINRVVLSIVGVRGASVAQAERA